MYGFLLAVLILISFVVIVAVLLQAGKGGGLAASFGGAGTSDAFLGTRQAGNLLTKVSWYGGGLFLFLAFVLQLMSARTRIPSSVLDQPFSATPAAPAPTTAPPASVIPLDKNPAADSTPSTTQPKQP